MKRIFYLVLPLVLLCGCTTTQNPDNGHTEAPTLPSTPADWTVLVFLNADNSLDPESLDDFREMAKVGSSDRVNVVLQWDRLGEADPKWEKTKRLKVTKNLAVPSNESGNIGEINMGSPDELRKFIVWGKASFPANHYALVIWDHGQGFRAATRGMTTAHVNHATSAPAVRGAGFRSISSDDTNGGDKLYNKEVHDAVAGQGIDIIGFDACLMSMVETAYVLRDDAKVMVGS